MRPRFSAPWGAMSLMLRCFSARKFSLFPLPSQHENEFFFRKRCCEGMFFGNSPTFCRKLAPLAASLPPFSAHPIHPWVKPAGASHTRVHVRPHTRPPQSLFVFCLHSFTVWHIGLVVNCLRVKGRVKSWFTFSVPSFTHRSEETSGQSGINWAFFSPSSPFFAAHRLGVCACLQRGGAPVHKG